MEEGAATPVVPGARDQDGLSRRLDEPVAAIVDFVDFVEAAEGGSLEACVDFAEPRIDLPDLLREQARAFARSAIFEFRLNPCQAGACSSGRCFAISSERPITSTSMP